MRTPFQWVSPNHLGEFRDPVVVDGANHVHTAAQPLDVHVLVRRDLSFVEDSIYAEFTLIERYSGRSVAVD